MTDWIDKGAGAWHCDTWLMSCRVLGRRVEEIRPTTINDRAIRYRATNDAPPARDPAHAPVAPKRRDADRHPDPAPVSVDLAQPRARDAGANDRDDRWSEADRAAAGLAERTDRVRRAMGSVSLTDDPALDSMIVVAELVQHETLAMRESHAEAPVLPLDELSIDGEARAIRLHDVEFRDRAIGIGERFG